MSRQMTVTLDEDVAAKLEGAARQAGVPAQDIVNGTLRRALPATAISPRPFKVKPRRMGSMTGLHLDCLERLLNEVEGPNWK